VNLRILHEQLTRRVQQWGCDARENRQVYRRLAQLLPDRLKDMISKHRGQGLGPAHSTRAALISDELIAHIDEMVQVGANSAEARIQYETHMMLIDARRALRGFRAK
jgi:hypothetical protein